MGEELKMTERHWRRLIQLCACVGLLVGALLNGAFGRWDVGTFLLVWACWLDLKINGRFRD